MSWAAFESCRRGAGTRSGYAPAASALVAHVRVALEADPLGPDVDVVRLGVAKQEQLARLLAVRDGVDHDNDTAALLGERVGLGERPGALAPCGGVADLARHLVP